MSSAVANAARTGLHRWLFLLVPLLPFTVLLTWWLLGFRDYSPVRGFSTKPVSFDFTDISLAEAFATLQPGTRVEYQVPAADLRLSRFQVNNMKERDALMWIVALVQEEPGKRPEPTRFEIVLVDEVIIVRSVPWLVRSHWAVGEWAEEELGIDLWP